MSATITPVRGVAATEYRIVGALPNVLKAIEALFGQYHPAGYDTRVHAIEHNGEQYVARVSRANSCE